MRQHIENLRASSDLTANGVQKTSFCIFVFREPISRITSSRLPRAPPPARSRLHICHTCVAVQFSSGHLPGSTQPVQVGRLGLLAISHTHGHVAGGWRMRLVEVVPASGAKFIANLYDQFAAATRNPNLLPPDTTRHKRRVFFTRLFADTLLTHINRMDTKRHCI